jgi:predicted N-acyltransferase
MPDTSPVPFTLSVCDTLGDVPRAEWNAVANPASLPYDPFLDWDFLEAAESSGCAAPSKGWTPHHLLVKDDAGKLVAAAPLYLKAHSRGEFVFDWAWADAFERAGGRYYPKLLCAAPFTPVTGRRLLAGDGAQGATLKAALARAMLGVAKERKVSSLHANFLGEEDAAVFEREGLLARRDQQFHWFNRGYQTFDDFLGALSSRKRKMVRRERAAAQAGLRIERITGADLKKAHWDAFYAFYQDTGGRKWGSPYLNRRFFTLLHERMAEKVLLVLAYVHETPIAGALNLIGSDALYGRYWGRSLDVSFLHFEVCYYQAIEFAIERGLSRVEAGAQGEHKLARGYEPTLTRSAHWIAHSGLREAVSDFLDHERPAVAHGVEELAAYTPFRKDGLRIAASGTDPAPDEEGF